MPKLEKTTATASQKRTSLLVRYGDKASVDNKENIEANLTSSPTPIPPRKV